MRTCHNFHQITFQEEIFFDEDMCPNFQQILHVPISTKVTENKGVTKAMYF